MPMAVPAPRQLAQLPAVLAAQAAGADVVVEAISSYCNTEWLESTDLDRTDGLLCDSVLRVARTIADLAGDAGVTTRCIGEALALRVDRVGTG